MRRIRIKRNYYEIAEHKGKKFIISRSTHGIIDKSKKWKIIPLISFGKKPKTIYRGFSKKKEAMDFLKKL